jgi:peptide/nickel transport system permease protein
MLTYCLRRLIALPPILIGMSTLVFVIMRWIPGDVISVLLGAETASISAETAGRMRASLGLDRPLYEQYLVWLWALCAGTSASPSSRPSRLGRICCGAGR